MVVTLRKARLLDLDALAAIEYGSFATDQLSRSAFRRAIRSPSQRVYVASLNGVIAGYMVLHIRSSSSIIRLYSIAVLSSFRGQGIASRLIAQAFRIGRQLRRRVISLEARADDARLVAYYVTLGFSPRSVRKAYYGDGADALVMLRGLDAPPRMRKKRRDVVVVPRERDRSAVTPLLEMVNQIEIITAQQFLSRHSDLGRSIRVINLCPAEEYLSSGYYVSLVAEARGNRTWATIDALSGLVNRKLYRHSLDELNKLLPSTAIINEHMDAHQRKLQLEFYFGQTDTDWARRLARRCYQLFGVPILEVQLVWRQRRWQVDYLWPLAIASVDRQDVSRFNSAMARALNARLPMVHQPKNATFDLAILVEPTETLPPSDKRALAAFARAAERHGMRSEWLTETDIDRLGSFDALFIRATTQIGHYTHQFAAAAEKRGMPVIDDPQSILRCSNKVFLMEALSRASLSMPETWMLTKSTLEAVSRQITYPAILKIPDGSFSRGMHKAQSRDDLIALATPMLSKSFVILAQEFMPSDFDWRIGVLDGEPLFACKYFMSRGHWQIYQHLSPNRVRSGGFQAVAVEEVPHAVLEAAIRSTLTIGRGLYGVDVKEIDGRPYIIEVNDNPNIDMGVEDLMLGSALYDRIIQLLRDRILASKGLIAPAVNRLAS